MILLSIGILVLFGIEVLTVIPVTALLCRFQLAHQKRVSFVMAFGGALVMPLVIGILALCLDSGLWSPDPFAYRDVHIQFYAAGLGLLAVLGFWPALGVVIYYRMRSKRDEKQAA